MTLARVKRRARATAQSSTARWLAVVIAVAVLSVTAGYTAGARSNVAILTAHAVGGANQVSARGDDGWWYAVPVDTVLWTDASGAEHDSGRADCLPRLGAEADVQFAAVSWSIEGTGGRNVVWIYCRK